MLSNIQSIFFKQVQVLIITKGVYITADAKRFHI